MLIFVQIPVSKDVCIFCLARIQFASPHALRRTQRRLLSSTRAFHRPPANQVAQKDEDAAQNSDTAWRGPSPRLFGGGWAKTRTAVPSDLTPEEKALRDALLQKESSRDPPIPQTASLKDGHTRKTHSLRIRKHLISTPTPSERGGTKVPEGAQIPSHLSQQNGRFPGDASAEASQVTSDVGSLEKNNGPRIPQARPIEPPLSPSEPRVIKRSRVRGWAKSQIVTELAPDEQALRQALQKEADPTPPLPKHRVSHSPHTSSVPGYPSRPEQQIKYARSEEIARASPVQTSSVQRQGTHESTSRSRLFEHQEARDAQLDHHISQARMKPEFRLGDWYCPSCEQHNYQRDRTCIRCQTEQPFIMEWQCEDCGNYNLPGRRLCMGCQRPGLFTPAQENPEIAEHWRHIRRTGSDASSEHLQPEQFAIQGRSGDNRTVSKDNESISKIRLVERETMARMERTKGGDFVGLRSQHESATSKAMKDSYWSLDTNETQVPTAGSTTSHTFNKPTTGSGLVDWRAHSTDDLQAKEVQGIRDRRSDQEDPDKFSKDSPRTEKLTGGWKRWEPSVGGETSLPEPSPSLEVPPPERPSFVKSSHRDTSDRNETPTDLSSTELEHEQSARSDFPTREETRRTRRGRREPGVAKQLLYDTITAYDRSRSNDRHLIRKSKKVLSIYDDADEEDGGRARQIERKEQRKKAKATKKAMAPPTPIYLPEFISVSNLANVLRVSIEEFIYKMKDLGFEETTNDHILDAETAGLVAAEFNFEPIFEQAENPDLLPRPPAEDKSVLTPRPPVVTIMGHVDHGKTTLLDYLRKSSVAASEHGGITQHIGAFSVPMPGGRLVTFLDTPGHEAFLSMRQRGANVTDIVILVVAADDSVKPQTVEAIRHAQTARVPMIVAVNKIDKEDSRPERVKQDLARYGVEIEDYGGDTQVVCVSGKTGQGMEELEDAAVALADILDMRSETDGQAEGWVLEATTKKAGRVATVLVRRGTLRPGDIIVAGTSWARVRSLRNEAGVVLKFAGPGTPVEIDGWREQPAAGDEVLQAPDEQKAKAVIEYRLEAFERTQMATDMAAVNEARRLEQEKREESAKAAELAENNPDATAAAAAAPGIEGQSTPMTPSFQEIFFIIKADVSGSVEAVTNAVSALGNSEVRPHILRTGVGPVTEFDIDHAAVAKGLIISFNTTIDANIQRTAEAKEVKILNQNIIYRLVDDVKAKLSEKLPNIVTQKVLGEAEIAHVFQINMKGRLTVPVAGCKIRNGVIGRDHKIRVLRGKETIYDGMLHQDAYAITPCADNDSRHAFFPQERQEGRHRDAKRQRVRHGL